MTNQSVRHTTITTAKKNMNLYASKSNCVLNEDFFRFDRLRTIYSMIITIITAEIYLFISEMRFIVAFYLFFHSIDRKNGEFPQINSNNKKKIVRKNGGAETKSNVEQRAIFTSMK